ncbi:MAG: flavin monoamine oxidase family protein [Solirubrobacterales bacterium]
MAETMEEGSFDVAVVGAGLAGLTAARVLTARGRRVVVLEASEQVGGRTRNHTFDDGSVVEIGGQWVGPTQDRLYAYAAELGVETYPTYDDGENLLHVGGELKRYRGGTFGLPVHVAADVALAQLRLERMSKRVPLEAPWMAPRAREWDGQTFATWIDRNLYTSLGRRFLRVAVQAVFSAEAEDMSLLHFLFYVHSGGDLDLLLGTAGGAQESRFVGGSQLVSQRLTETLGDAVWLSSPVLRISQNDDGVTVGGGWGELRARRCVVTAPPSVIGRIGFDPPLSGRRAQLHAKLPAGHVIKCLARYERPFWRSDGLNGQADSATHPLAVCFDNSPREGSAGILLGFLEGRHARRASSLGAVERRALVLDGFATYFGERAREPLEYVEQDWAQEEWIRGGYGAHFPPGVWTQYGDLLRRPEGRIHWAGTETSPVWNGYMDGAIRSGERVAAELA